MVDNVTPAATWEALKADSNACLVDVRTDMEWNTIGVPDLGDAGKEPVLVQWQVFPAMQINDRFIDDLRDAGVTPDQTIYFLCRSGVRSMHAARLAQSAGFSKVFNVADGFEGPPDGSGRRGTTAGWQADGLPWRK
jgi:rhodanese-related sulfurtransferase